MAYSNFEAAVFCTLRCVEGLADSEKIRNRLSFLNSHIDYSKVYIETYRGMPREGISGLEDLIISDEKIAFVKELFEKKGIQTAGAITTNGISRDGRFVSLCYSNPEHLRLLEKTVEKTARFFDEIILDDFYFTNCKCEYCLGTKGTQNREAFRRSRLNEASENIVMKTARKTNPKVKVIIKYPNWYDHYHATGYDTEREPQLFDGVYTGVETRDDTYTQQNTQKYLGYFLMRWMENLSGGRNGGGWLDPFDCRNRLEDYISQIFSVLFAKGREVTFFCLSRLLFDDAIFVPLAGFVMKEFDPVLPLLGNPTGLACYKPFHSDGEDFLHTYLGGAGIALEPYAAYPEKAGCILLTQSAAKDPDIVARIRGSLLSGSHVIVSSGLLRVLQDRGFDQLCSIRVSDKKVTADRFALGMSGCAYKTYTPQQEHILFPELTYYTNDCFPLVAGLSAWNSFPFLIEDRFAEGRLSVIAIPENPGDIYRLPEAVLDRLRETCTPGKGVRVTGISRCRLFLYDNDTFIIQSGLEHNHTAGIVIDGKAGDLLDIERETVLEGRQEKNRTYFTVPLAPASYRVFRVRRQE